MVPAPMANIWVPGNPSLWGLLKAEDSEASLQIFLHLLGEYLQ